MKISGMEKRWLRSALAALIPARANARFPLGALDTAAVKLSEEMLAQSPFLAAMGVRAAIWVAYLFPLFIVGKLKTLSGLSPDEQDRYLNRLYDHPLYLIRQTILLLKSVACLSYLADDRVREALGMMRPRNLPIGPAVLPDVEATGRSPLPGGAR
jgi:hypothetical protein